MNLGDWIVTGAGMFCLGALIAHGEEAFLTLWNDRREWRKMKRLGKRRPVPALQRKTRR